MAMGGILEVAGVVLALVGGLTLFRALFMPKRYHERRPRLFLAGWGALAIALLFFALASGWVPNIGAIFGAPS